MNIRNFIRSMSMGLLILVTCLLTACGNAAIGNASAPTAGVSPTVTPSPTSKSTATPTPTIAPVVQKSKIPLLSIRMLDQNNGWALTAQAVLKTQDGGQHWNIMTVLPTLSDGLTAAGDFMNVTYAWVAFRDPTASVGVFKIIRTTDGGAHWLTTVINDPAERNGIDRPHFLTTQQGWVLIATAEGMHHTSADIFHTADGGQSWYKVASTDPQSQSGLPDGGNKTGISLKDTQNLWATAEIPAFYSWLYTSSNGGKTWHQQSLPLPQGISNGQDIGDFQTTPPIFFGNDGLLPAIISNQGQERLVFYVTHNGGQSWISTKLTNFYGGNVFVLDMQHAWASDTPLSNAFYGTSDGGQNWTRLSTTPQPVGELSFVDATTGWAIGTLSSKTPLLLHTIDGGKTWQSIGYSIQ